MDNCTNATLRPLETTRVLHVITSLGVGGAERMLHKVLGTATSGRTSHAVICLTDGGPIADDIRALGVPVKTLGMRPGRATLRDFVRLVRIIGHARPDTVQTWMYHADLLGGVAARTAGVPRIIWGVRGGIDPGRSKLSSRLTARACAAVSQTVPDVITTCASSLSQSVVELGYPAAKMRVIPNGFDTAAFAPSATAQHSLRSELGLPANARTVGIVARYDPQKDHATFIAAAGRVASRAADVFFVMAGEGIDGTNETVTAAVAATGYSDRFFLLGRRADMPGLSAALDVAVLASAFGEGFPNVLGEAMASGTPCVTTDCGDARAVVGDTGIVVPVSDPQRLAAAIEKILGLPKDAYDELARQARDRVLAHFSLRSSAAQFESIWLSSRSA